MELNSLLIAPRATPSRAAKASTSAGLITRLNEFTIDRPKAPRLPMVIAANSGPRSSPLESSVISGDRIQVAIAVRITTPSVTAVFWTTESIVIGPVDGGACVGCPGTPGVPVPHVAGSAP